MLSIYPFPSFGESWDGGSEPRFLAAECVVDAARRNGRLEPCFISRPDPSAPREGKGQVRIRPQPPSVCAEERRARRIRARDCLSEASSSETPPEPSTAGCPGAPRRGRRQQGRLSFAYFSLAKQRKVSSRRATPGQLPSAKPNRYQFNSFLRPYSKGQKPKTSEKIYSSLDPQNNQIMQNLRSHRQTALLPAHQINLPGQVCHGQSACTTRCKLTIPCK